MSTKRQYPNAVIIPDSHSHPNFNNDRFEILGNYVLEKQPDIVIDIGDSADMGSLCAYDMGTLHAEGRRYKDDIAAYHDAMERFWKPINKYNNTRSRWKKRQYMPRLVKCTGNHEYRIHRASVEDPKYYGHISMDDLKEAEYGWEVIPFLKPFIWHDIVFKHYFSSGVMGRPISGEHIAANMVKKGVMSCVAGHSHMRDFWETCDASGRKRFGLVVGCYLDFEPEYTTERDRWWSGLVRLHDVREGQADHEFINIDYLKRKFS